MKNSIFTLITGIAAANPGGFTYDVINNVTPSTGYAVALAATQNSHGADGLESVISLVLSGSTPAQCIGGWLDESTGLYYWDATVVLSDRAAAIKLGRANGQIAIFDLDNMEEIRL